MFCCNEFALTDQVKHKTVHKVFTGSGSMQTVRCDVNMAGVGVCCSVIAASASSAYKHTQLTAASYIQRSLTHATHSGMDKNQMSSTPGSAAGTCYNWQQSVTDGGSAWGFATATLLHRLTDCIDSSTSLHYSI